MFHDLINLFYPKDCAICEEILTKNEHVICIKCLHELPVSNYHLHNDNPVAKVFYGRINLESATSLLLFHKKSNVQTLIHQLKYRGRKEIGGYLGIWTGNTLASVDNFKNIDIIIPVPLHKKKLKSRGYNQVEDFGKEIANVISAEYIDNVLLKTSFTATQTLKSRLARWNNIEETFVVQNPELLKNKHVLLVDDLITTGATIEACANILADIPGIKISVVSMAFTE